MPIKFSILTSALTKGQFGLVSSVDDFGSINVYNIINGKHVDSTAYSLVYSPIWI